MLILTRPREFDRPMPARMMDPYGLKHPITSILQKVGGGYEVELIDFRRPRFAPASLGAGEVKLLITQEGVGPIHTSLRKSEEVPFSLGRRIC